jgi:hypothetical protein
MENSVLRQTRNADVLVQSTAHGSGSSIQASAVHVELEQFSPRGAVNERNAASGMSEEVEPESPWQPTRTYQAMLLAAGFGMIFQVIGINSIYGIFQVSTN